MVRDGHRGGACSHVFGFRVWRSNWCWHGRVGFDENGIVENHTSDGRMASVWAILPAGIRKNGEVGMWYAMLVAYVVDRIGIGVGVVCWALL